MIWISLERFHDLDFLGKDGRQARSRGGYHMRPSNTKVLDPAWRPASPNNFPSGLGSNALHGEKSLKTGDFHAWQITYGRWVMF